jgi:hypothetical protein
VGVALGPDGRKLEVASARFPSPLRAASMAAGVDPLAVERS